MALRTYDPGKIFASLGAINIQGYADGTFISVQRITDTFGSVAGAGGEVARVRQRDKRGSIKFTLMATSPTNDALSALAASDELLGTGVVRFHLVDANGTTILYAANAWVKKLPNMEFAKELSNREWEIECERIEMVAFGASIGGNF